MLIGSEELRDESLRKRGFSVRGVEEGSRVTWPACESHGVACASQLYIAIYCTIT